ncbi:Uncharacterized protein dnm_066090 [Desulfonema magnum]|uniref:Uncharacterized protein n=1 Tax=Desulfonema magnum TaxID=45655 RepID=A0A975BST1_9BACT|nr:Uncharacterized protein dnm_066090 [Desulfonema magnum]
MFSDSGRDYKEIHTEYCIFLISTMSVRKKAVYRTKKDEQQRNPGFSEGGEGAYASG